MNDILLYFKQLGTDAAIKLVIGLLILIIGIKLSKKIVKLLSNGKAFSKLDKSAQSFINSFIKIALYALVIASACILWGVPSTAFVTVFTSAGVAIGLALQGALSNFAGGLLILFFHPFKVGDYIEGDGIGGTVKEITVIYTILTTPDNQKVTIPNGALTNAKIINYSVNKTRRIDLTFSTSYEADIDTVKKVLLDVASNHEKILKDPAPFARLKAHNASSLDYAFRVYVKSADYWDVYFDLMEDVKKAFDKNNIEIPYSKLDVNITK